MSKENAEHHSPGADTSSHQDTQKVIKTIRADPERVKEMLDSLDEKINTEKINTEDQTKQPKDCYPYRKTAVITIHTKNQGSIPFVVMSHRLDPDGMTFLFGGFIYSDTLCHLRLTTIYGAWIDIAGTIDTCNFIDDNIHVAYIRFTKPVEPSIFVAEAVHPRVLLVEDDKLYEHVARKHLEQLNAIVDHAKNGQEAVEKALNNIYDIVLMDMEMPVMNGYAATSQLRERGYIGTIVATTGMTQPEDKERCFTAGCDHYIPKPYSYENLVDLFESLQGEPIFSEFESDPAMHEIIGMFIVELPGRIRAIEEALLSENSKNTADTLRSLKAVAGACGFGIITEKSAELESKIIEGVSIDQLKDDIVRLIKTCFKARSSARAVQAAINDKPLNHEEVKEKTIPTASVTS